MLHYGVVLWVLGRGSTSNISMSVPDHTGAISSIRIRAVPLWEFNQEKIDAN
jgi:hypothetical protein